MSAPEGDPPTARIVDRRALVWVLLLALLLQIPAHVGFSGAGASESGGRSGRDALYEDGPALVSNPAFEAFGSEGLGDVLKRAVAEPGAAWGEGDGAVGRSQRRPVSVALAALERWTLRSNTAEGAAVVSLLLHLAVVGLTVGLLGRAGAPRAAQWIAGAVVAAGPAALTAAAWPAHQATVLATALGLAGLVVAQRPGFARAVAAGALLALAGLAHEMAFGFAVALVAARWWRWSGLADADDARAADRGRIAWPTLVLAGAAGAFSLAGRSGPGGGGTPAVLDGLVGIFHAAVSLLVPARMHFADGPWTSGVAGHAAAVAAGVLGTLAVRRASPGPRGLAAAAFLVLLPGAAARAVSAAGAPFHDGMLYVVAPLAAGAVAWIVANAMSRGGALRIAAIVAAGAWVGAVVCSTATRTASFRTREAHVRLAELEMPDSPVVEAWSLDLATSEADRSSSDRRERIRGLAGRAEDLGRRVGGANAEAWRRDPVAAVTVASVLTRYTMTLVGSGIAPGDASLEQAETGAAAAAELVPGWMRPWLALALVRERAGALRDAMDASQRAATIARDDVDVIATGVRVGLALGDIHFASFVSETLLVREKQAAKDQGRRTRPDVMLLFARAQSSDGASRVADPFGGPGVRFRAEAAIAVLRELVERGELVADAKRELYHTCLEYGDVLVSLDRTALASLAYREAIAAVGDAPGAEEAKDHLTQLTTRLRAEEAKAQASVDRAMRGEGNVADALVALGIAFSRQARFKDCEEVFGRLEAELGMTPVLRYHRAVHLHRETDPETAVRELRQVVRDAPALARAHYELARILEEAGDLVQAVESYREARRLVVEQAASGGAEEWLLDADDRFEALERMLREQESLR